MDKSELNVFNIFLKYEPLYSNILELYLIHVIYQIKLFLVANVSSNCIQPKQIDCSVWE